MSCRNKLKILPPIWKVKVFSFNLISSSKLKSLMLTRDFSSSGSRSDIFQILMKQSWLQLARRISPLSEKQIVMPHRNFYKNLRNWAINSDNLLYFIYWCVVIISTNLVLHVNNLFSQTNPLLAKLTVNSKIKSSYPILVSKKFLDHYKLKQ